MEKEVRWFGPETRVLLLLLDKDRMKRKDFQKEGMDYRVAVSALNKLRDHFMVDFEEMGDYHETQIWFLTKKGIKVARTLSDLIETIERDRH